MDHEYYPAVEIMDAIMALRRRVEFEQLFAAELPVCAGQGPDKETQAAKLYQSVKVCTRCALQATRTNVVFGDGDLNAKLVFVGEAPGRDEDAAGKPFVGAAGQLLSKIINAMGMRREDVYITNVLRCRPPNNRDPLPEEVFNCRYYLNDLLDIIKPKVICSLGKFASQALLESAQPISRLRGRFHNFQGILLMPTFHPAYLLRNPDDKKLVWEDMKKIIEYLKRDET